MVGATARRRGSASPCGWAVGISKLIIKTELKRRDRLKCICEASGAKDFDGLFDGLDTKALMAEAEAIAEEVLGPHPTKENKSRASRSDAKYLPIDTSFGKLRAHVGKVKCYIRLVPEGEQKKEQCLWGYQGS